MRDNYSRNRLKGLKQFQEMSDDEFDDYMDEKESSVDYIKDFEERIKTKMDEFSQDYDLDDMKINDRNTLRNLIQASIKLEDLERVSHKVMYQSEGRVDDVDVLKMDKINTMMSVLRKDISTMQNDLNITRKVRKGDENLSVVSELERLKLKAKEFIEAKLQYVFCECGELLGNYWVLYPSAKNKFSFTCQRKLANGEICGKVTTVYSKDVLELRGTNRPEIVPEYFK